MVRLGAWSAALLVLALQCLILAVALSVAGGNRRANLMLALLMLVVAGLLTPFILGYAGAYDAWPWLTFAPLAVPLAVGPLLYAHVVALARSTGIARWHWLAPVLQFAWQAALFPLPLASKNAIDAAVIEPFLGPLNDAAVIVSMIAYGLASWRVLRNYSGWLEQRRRDRRPAGRIRLLLLIILPLIAARAGYSLFEALVRPITYFDLFGYYLLLGVSALALGLLGWRQAGEATPAAIDEDAAWRARGEDWAQRLREEKWWRDPDLDLDALARHLGTNRAHLSRGLSSLGGFAAVVGGVRSDAVAQAIAEGKGANLLHLAHDCGFGSKASFNRAFADRFGISPSQYRASLGATGPLPKN